MLKKEFLDVLNQKLSLISDKEREDIILEYGTYIDDKIAGGVAEEEAVAGFGDVDELVKDILDAYKINTDSMDPFSNRFICTIRECLLYMYTSRLPCEPRYEIRYLKKLFCDQIPLICHYIVNSTIRVSIP